MRKILFLLIVFVVLAFGTYAKAQGQGSPVSPGLESSQGQFQSFVDQAWSNLLSYVTSHGITIDHLNGLIQAAIDKTSQFGPKVEEFFKNGIGYFGPVYVKFQDVWAQMIKRLFEWQTSLIQHFDNVGKIN